MTHNIDIVVENHGSTALLRPMSPEGQQWLIENVAAEPWQWFGGALVAEPRYVDDVVEGMVANGLTVEGGF